MEKHAKTAYLNYIDTVFCMVNCFWIDNICFTKIKLNYLVEISFCVILSKIIAKITMPVPPTTAEPISNLPRAT